MYAHPQYNGGERTKLLRREAGVWLKRQREARGLSQRDLATLVGVDYYTFISQIESGRGRIPPDRYAVFADALGVEPSLFVRTLLGYYDPITYELLFSQPPHTAANTP
jgi:transcriptional regulator with XRE-family HTH domain